MTKQGDKSQCDVKSLMKYGGTIAKTGLLSRVITHNFVVVLGNQSEFTAIFH
jgi:hypothetical protein